MGIAFINLEKHFKDTQCERGKVLFSQIKHQLVLGVKGFYGLSFTLSEG
jgi:hypothetical protein